MTMKVLSETIKMWQEYQNINKKKHNTDCAVVLLDDNNNNK